ncbi:RRM domain-containing protein [Caerostris extrusa]|uniref:RRM domain-containing protein n=1 Tax=Caerostris extrusa TaxID=172846 RepID=A0AAV4MNT8_CAEEX|nr:RRM domain-containing protein [Caerostris extrusa]
MKTTKVSSVESVMNEDNKSSVKATATSRTEEIGEQTNSNKFKNSSNNSDNSTSDSVSVENLSSSTSEVQLRKLGSSVGVVQSIQLLKEQRKAIIKFKESLQALNFQKKYQRYMLDLAMIQVSLLV